MLLWGAIKGLKLKAEAFIDQKIPAVRKSINELQSESIFFKSPTAEMGFVRKEKWG